MYCRDKPQKSSQCNPQIAILFSEGINAYLICVAVKKLIKYLPFQIVPCTLIVWCFLDVVLSISETGNILQCKHS